MLPERLFSEEGAMDSEFTTQNIMAKQTPINEVRLGAIKAAIWKNDTDKGVRYNVTFSRIYKDGDDWKSTDSFGRDDLLVLGKVADLAHSWIHEQGQEEHEEKGKTSQRK
jgi:hypothetical protein